MKNGLVYLCKNREIKEIEFLPQTQMHRQLSGLILEDFLPLYVKNGVNVNHQVRKFLGNPLDSAELNDPAFYETISLFVDYVLNNNSFDVSDLIDSQFIPASTEIFIYSENPPADAPDNSATLYEIRDYTVAGNDVLINVQSELQQTRILTANINDNQVTLAADIFHSKNFLEEIRDLLAHRNTYLDAVMYQMDLTNTRLHDVNVKLAQIEENTSV